MAVSHAPAIFILVLFATIPPSYGKRLYGNLTRNANPRGAAIDLPIYQRQTPNCGLGEAGLWAHRDT